jgi:transcriptional regulator with XRE-family HTH domain
VPYKGYMIEPAQCRAARALLDLNQDELAKAAGLGHATLKRFERGVHMLINNNMAALIRALEEAGVEFIARTKTKGPGVRLRE